MYLNVRELAGKGGHLGVRIHGRPIRRTSGAIRGGGAVFRIFLA
jgi:hypothetical protein